MAEHAPARQLEVREVVASVTVQDLGRRGRAHLGVPRSGALDEPAHRLANRLVGNPEEAATLECLGGLVLVASTAVTVAVTGARVALRVGGRQRDWANAVSVPALAVVEVGAAVEGVRAYLAVSGGIEVEPVLGSRSTDLLSGLGPEPVRGGDLLPVGRPARAPAPVEVVRPPRVTRVLRVQLGPRDDWFEPASVEAMDGAAYTVGTESNRIGLRLEGPPLRRRDDAELPSEGMVLGAVQVPPSGQPVVFLNDHPTTGGYPVVGVVLAQDLAQCAQLRPGDEVTLRMVRPVRAPGR